MNGLYLSFSNIYFGRIIERAHERVRILSIVFFFNSWYVCFYVYYVPHINIIYWCFLMKSQNTVNKFTIIDFFVLFKLQSNKDSLAQVSSIWMNKTCCRYLFLVHIYKFTIVVLWCYLKSWTDVPHYCVLWYLQFESKYK